MTTSTSTRGEIGPKVDRIGPKWDKFWTFSDRISVSQAKMYWNSIWESPGFIPFDANLANFVPTSGHPDTDGLGLRFYLMCMTWLTMSIICVQITQIYAFTYIIDSNDEINNHVYLVSPAPPWTCQSSATGCASTTRPIHMQVDTSTKFTCTLYQIQTITSLIRIVDF